MQNLAIRLKQFLTADWSFIGVILYFIIHGYTENEMVVPFTSLLPVLGELLVAGVLLFLLNRRLLGNKRKGNIFSAIIFIVVLYFGVIQSFLLTKPLFEPISRFRVLVPLSFLIMAVSFIWLKKATTPLIKPVLFLNILLIIYLFIDAGTLLNSKLYTKHQYAQLSNINMSGCDTCQKPPVYLVLFDSYFGSQGLKEYFQYDNSRFEQSLTDLGFHVVQASTSNYKYTVFSMASLLNMQYLPNIGDAVIENHFGFNTALATLNNNAACQYFARQGYTINNYSIFEIGDNPGDYNLKILPAREELVTSHTMYYRVTKSLVADLAKKGLIAPGTFQDEKAIVSNNMSIMKKALAFSHTDNKTPTFTYVHVLMPHSPYILDSMGNSNHFIQRRDQLPKDSIDNMFLQYEVYANNVITKFISQLQKETKGKAVVLLMSDHGYHLLLNEPGKLPFYNLNAIYMPQGNYQGWYNGISNVNQFRVLFNTLFHEQIPLLPDSLVVH
jgi:hypothetical protein